MNIENIEKFENFTYWFKLKQSESYDALFYEIYNKENELINVCYDYIDNRSGANINILGEVSMEAMEAIKTDWEKFKTRPEYMVGRYSTIVMSGAADNIVTNMIDDYELLLMGAFLARKYDEDHENPDKYIEIFNNRCLKWLENTDFYSAPSSTRYHDACEGGLLFHSLKVYNLMLEFLNCETFKDIDPTSVIITSLTHDWTKIGLYEAYNKNVKNEATGQWEQVTAYKHNQKGVPLGHGVTSMFLASKCFSLTTDEMLAIRWHMSYWSVAPGEDAEMALACDTYPLVELIQFADQLSTRPYAVCRKIYGSL